MNGSDFDVVTDSTESLVVLTHDEELLFTLRAVAADHEISIVGAEADLASHLVDDHAGVAVIDTEAVTSPVGQLCDRLKSQFPDLVLIVAGHYEDQGQLTTQITRGTVYRFLNKPVSEQRVRLFVTAAWRRHGVEHAEIIEATSTNLRRPAWTVEKPAQKNMFYLAGAAGLLLLLGAIWLFTSGDEAPPTVAGNATPGAPNTAATNDPELEKLLQRADSAVASGALTAPAGDNAVELYRLALRRSPNDPRAAAGLDRVLNLILTSAEQALLQEKVDEAAQFVEIARAINPSNVRVAFLTAQIGKERERALLTRARQAAASGDVDQAIAVLDRGALTGNAPPPASETRQSTPQRTVDNRVGDYLRRADERFDQGALVEPAQNNARFFIEAARAIAPNQSEVRQAQRRLADNIIGQARAAITAGNADEAERWIVAATDSGVSRDDITALTRDVQRVRIAAKADAMAKLSQSFNQRLAQGRLVDPTNDSAKFFLTRLAETEATHPSTQLARQALSARFFQEARGSIERQDFAAARRWMSEAKSVGANESGTAELEKEITAAQNSFNRGDDDIVPASQLMLTRYVPPEYPSSAREKGTDGYVDVLFTVRSDGSITDVGIGAAEPAGIFEQAAISAVRRWKYQPVRRDGRPVEQRARVRIRFAIEE